MSNKKRAPHTGIYALILNNSKTHILLIKKARGPYTGLYDLPGGTPEFEEEFIETLEREVREETSLSVEKSQQLVSLLALFEQDNVEYRHLGIIYSVSATGVPKSDPDGEDSNGCVWLDLHKISQKNCSPFVNQLRQKEYISIE